MKRTGSGKKAIQNRALARPSCTDQELAELLEQAKVQPTAQRLAICKFVLCEANHPSADEVKAWADRNFPKISLATVYNTLNRLVEAGLLREYRFPHTEKVIYDHNVTHHFHFLDEQTGELTDLEPDQIEIRPKFRGLDLSISRMDVVVHGRKKK